MRKYLNWISIIGIVWALFQLYLAGIGPMTAQVQRAIHVGFALALTFLMFRRGQNSKWFVVRNFDYVLAILSILSGLYVYLEADRLVSRIQFVSKLEVMDYVVCIAVVVMLLDAALRTVGKAMTILAVIFIVYAFAGQHIPGALHHNGLNLKRMVETMYFSLDGVLGVPIGVAVDYVFYFVLFGAFLEISGGGKLFIDLAFRMTKRSKGGPAKAAVLASSGMGSISGSAVANVVSTGVFTIPLMKRAGFKPTFAASVEALASTGGQILPPIMGAAAFIMADTIGIPYSKVVLAAIIPALLYYVAIFIMVHLKSVKENIGGVEDDEKSKELAEKKETYLNRIHLLLPLVILLYFIFSGKTLQLAAFWSILAIIAISYVRKSTWLSVSDIFDGLISGAKQSVQVSIPCAVAGIIVGVIIHSGIGLKFTSLVIDLSNGVMILSVIFVAIGCIILGMGMPTTSAYIMGAVLLAPALQQLGFVPMASHMFILYLASLSMITPPVALASYSAATIANCDANKTGWLAFYLCLPGFLIPISFIFNPELLLIGEPAKIAWVTFTTLLGIGALSSAIIGHLFGNLNTFERVLLVAAAICMIIDERFTDVVGLAVFAAIIVVKYLADAKRRREQSALMSK